MALIFLTSSMMYSPAFSLSLSFFNTIRLQEEEEVVVEEVEEEEEEEEGRRRRRR